jgi:RNA polymerase sigma factor (sigma-70 family)
VASSRPKELSVPQRLEQQMDRDVDAVTRDLSVHRRRTGRSARKAEQPSAPKLLIDQVVVGDIPLQPPGFQPRASLLAELDRAGAGVTVIQAAAELPGLGATQLAAAYARAKLAARWRLVAWVNGSDAASLQAGLAAVADAIGLTDDESGHDVTDCGLAVRQWLETDGDRCLLVLDDVSDPELLLQSFVPASGTARVLVTGPSATSPAANLQTGAPVVVDVFSAEEARSFLTGRTGLDDEAGAARLAAALGHLPLALALAAPMISGQRHGYERYLDRLQAMPTEIYLTAKNGEPYAHRVARAVLLPLATIRSADKTGICARVMAIVSVLSAAGVRRELLYIAGRAGLLANGGHRVEAAVVDQALEWLSDRSLLTFSLDGRTVVTHRLVAQVVRQGLIRGRRLGAVCWVAASVLEAHAIAVAGSQDRSAVRRIPQQVTALDNTAELAGEIDEELAEILLRLRFIALYHLIELGDSAPQAIAIGEPLTADLERLLGPGQPDTLNARNSLAAAYLAAQRVLDAIPLLERNLVVLQRELDPDHPDILTSQNNLASAYQDAGRFEEAIRLYELTLIAREQELGIEHPSTLASRSNLAAAYLAAGRLAEAVWLQEQTLADRERVLGPDHPDTQKSRKNLAKAYQEAGREADATPLLEKVLADRQRDRARASAAGAPTLPGSQNRAAADAAAKAFRAGTGRQVPSLGLRRPPAFPAEGLLFDRLAGRAVKRAGRSSVSRTRDRSRKLAEHERKVVAAIKAGDPAGIAMAYHLYAADLYGYCHWMLHDLADAAESLQDAYVVAAARRRDLREPHQLRPWLFALARNECRRRIGPQSAAREEYADAANQQGDAGLRPDDLAVTTEASHRATDVTLPYRVLTDPAGEIYEPIDGTGQFPVVSEPADATVPLPVVSQLTDVTMPFRVVSEPGDGLESLAYINDYMGQAELRELIRSILADLKPSEREVIELSLRHDLDDNDLAIVLGVSRSRAQALVSRAHGRLENSFGALRTALAGRDSCPVVGELLADWDGQLTEQTRDLVAWHVEQCQTCVHHGQGVLRSTALLGVLPLSPLPPELREQVLSRCSGTDETAVAYRRRVVRRAETKWRSRFSTTIRWVSWDGIRARPGPAVACAAVAVWVAAAVSFTLLTFAGSLAAHAQSHQPSAGHSSGRSGTGSDFANGRIPVIPGPSPTDSRPATQRPSLFQPSSQYLPTLYAPPRGSSSPSGSAKPPASPSATPAPTAAPTPTATPSPTATPAPTASPSSPTPTSPSASSSAT